MISFASNGFSLLEINQPTLLCAGSMLFSGKVSEMLAKSNVERISVRQVLECRIDKKPNNIFLDSPNARLFSGQSFFCVYIIEQLCV